MSPIDRRCTATCRQGSAAAEGTPSDFVDRLVSYLSAGDERAGVCRIVRVFPATPCFVEHSDVWLPYVERMHMGKLYRSYPATDPEHGEWADNRLTIGFPSDGSRPQNNFKAGGFYTKSKAGDGYRCAHSRQQD